MWMKLSILGVGSRSILVMFERTNKRTNRGSKNLRICYLAKGGGALWVGFIYLVKGKCEWSESILSLFEQSLDPTNWYQHANYAKVVREHDQWISLTCKRRTSMPGERGLFSTFLWLLVRVGCQPKCMNVCNCG
jgi:hypothetical protein